MYSRNYVHRIKLTANDSYDYEAPQLQFDAYHLPTFDIKNDFFVFLKQKIYKISAPNLKHFLNMLEKQI